MILLFFLVLNYITLYLLIKNKLFIYENIIINYNKTEHFCLKIIIIYYLKLLLKYLNALIHTCIHLYIYFLFFIL